MKQSHDVQKNTSRRQWFKKHGFSAVLYVLAGVVVLGLIGDAVAKYFQTSSDESVIHANWFYFNSDMTEGSPHTLNPGTTEVTFTVTNCEDSLRVTEAGIDYAVDVVSVPERGSASIVYGDSTTHLGKGSAEQDQITLSNLVPGTTYTVSVTGTASGMYPDGYTGGKYSKTLTFKIVVPEENVLYKYFEKKDGYILLTVWAQGYQGNVTISYPAGVVPDNTSPIAAMKGASAGKASINDAQTFSGSGYASAAYRFFITSGSPTASDFEVTYGTNQKADLKNPG